MTEEQLQHIETELRIMLPALYRQTMLAYPFGPDSLAADCQIPDDAQWVIERNKYHSSMASLAGRGKITGFALAVMEQATRTL